MDAKKCDRCGKFYEKYNHTYGVHKVLYTDAENGKFISSAKTMDLCLDCTDALVRFLYNADPQYEEPEMLEVYPIPPKGKTVMRASECNRKEEPRERRESNLEWLIENWDVAKEVVDSNVPCKIVRYAKYGKPCDAPFPDDYCSECEFYEKCGNNELNLLKVLAEPHLKENDHRGLKTDGKLAKILISDPSDVKEESEKNNNDKS